jgi:translation initiation factor IF-1
MKYILIVAALITLAACKEDERTAVESDSGRNYRVECLDGVEYWVRYSGHNGYMAVRVDPETMSFVRC